MIYVISTYPLVDGGAQLSVRSSPTPLAAVKTHMWKYHNFNMHGFETTDTEFRYHDVLVIVRPLNECLRESGLENEVRIRLGREFVRITRALAHQIRATYDCIMEIPLAGVDVIDWIRDESINDYHRAYCCLNEKVLPKEELQDLASKWGMPGWEPFNAFCVSPGIAASKDPEVSERDIRVQHLKDIQDVLERLYAPPGDIWARKLGGV